MKKARSVGKGCAARGSSTLEILVALAILSLALTAALLVFSSNQAVAIDTQTSDEALGLAEAQLEDARALIRQDFNQPALATTSSPRGPLTYDQALSISYLTPCLVRATSTASWQEGARQGVVSLTTELADLAGSLAVGGDCAAFAPASDWRRPARLSSGSLEGAKATALDVLGGVAYLGLDSAPYLAVAHVGGASSGQGSALFVPAENGFALDAAPHALDAVRLYDTVTKAYKTYLFAAVASSTAQLRIIDVTNSRAPLTIATTSLSSCVSGSFPQGWVAYYYKKTLYFLTRETAGPELHVFDVARPGDPKEYTTGSATCKGFELTGTVEDIVVRDQLLKGVVHRYAYLATDQNGRELRVLDVTDPLHPLEVPAASKDLPGTQDGASIFAVGQTLYLGRQSAPGADLYLFDISNPPAGLTTLGGVDIGTSVIDLAIMGRFAFIATPKVNKEFQVWDIADPARAVTLSTYHTPNVVAHGLDYEADRVYTAGQSAPHLEILSSL